MDRSPASESIWLQWMRLAENDDLWWRREWKEVGEWSEIVACPGITTSGYKHAGKFRSTTMASSAATSHTATHRCRHPRIR
ncbi:hypothetical protein TIFTF001_017726 [Ficus carica]|uniref:Uncharacterized protein n=1 Tax=Ficus carica TaxID=3494 RepID=A0AA88DB20_FICCA|nr:hypothetical protein TIFTF001_017726 [Ficus carica]